MTTPEQNLPYAQALSRSLKIVFFVLLISLALYWMVMGFVRVATTPQSLGVLRSYVTYCAFGTTAVVLFIRLRLISGYTSSDRASVTPMDLRKLYRYYVICFVLAEATGLWGFVLGVMGAPRRAAAPFFIGALLLYLLCYPRLPSDSNSR